MATDFQAFFRDRLAANRPLFLDGGMGTMIQQTGVTGFAIPEELTLNRPELIAAIHRQYLEAGSEIITTCTFGANPLKLAPHGLDPERVYASAAACVRTAIRQHGAANRWIAGDIGPLGQLLEPLGAITFDEAYSHFKACAIAAERAGVDLLLIETMTDLYELKAAVLAAKENTRLPVFASMAFEPSLKTLTGSDPEIIATVLEGLRVDALGFNCGGSLEDARILADRFCAATALPILTEPNAGLPVVEEGRTRFKIGPEPFAACQLENAMRGVRILGGCCGTTPAHIAELVKRMPEHLPARPIPPTRTRVASGRRVVAFGNLPDGPGPVVIGERINPTGKKRCKAALIAGDMGFILNEAESQLAAGAEILDVNVGLPGIDERAVMLRVVQTLQQTFDAPLQLDSSEPAVLEHAMRHINGKPLVNSVNGKQPVMDAVFPLIRKYGGTVVALCLDENGIPPTAEGRVAIAQRIIAEAATYGIAPNDILIDTLTLTISSQQREARATLDAITELKRTFGPQGLKTVLGVSNISFGLPRRELVNANFFAMALYAGLDAGIINPLSPDMMGAFRAYRAIGAFDRDCLDYISAYTGTVAASAPTPAAQPQTLPAEGDTPLTPLQELIVKGYADAVAAATEETLKTKSVLEIVDREIVPALDAVGREYEAGRKFLPQLLLSAKTVSRAFEVLKRALAESGQVQETKGTLIMATVAGDIHDIGKNIVIAMLENYGYTVIDLGKDVKAETIVETAIARKVSLIGLSALMTTTVSSMEETIRALREAEKRAGMTFKIAVGGAVLTEAYAKEIGADFYGKDAMATVAIARQVFGK
ncbi:MAG: homocysteine S-methyltransferase family protein [Kiritimatiellae bacterium]|nr:homocysteine S-methyltransferase family protein [Kiritimatiellia bacterium]